jgi:hypothetical protein
MGKKVRVPDVRSDHHQRNKGKKEGEVDRPIESVLMSRLVLPMSLSTKVTSRSSSQPNQTYYIDPEDATFGVRFLSQSSRIEKRRTFIGFPHYE